MIRQSVLFVIVWSWISVSTTVEGNVVHDRRLMEEPNIPSPRTAESCNNPTQCKIWPEAQLKLKKKIESKKHVNVAFYGDSITESLVGLQMGNPGCMAGRCSKIPAMFSEVMEENHLSWFVSGIGGDRTQHLLWRLTEGGEIPEGFDPDVVVILIGTNNLPHVPNPRGLLPVLDGIMEIVKVFRNALPNTVILLNEIFPRADGPSQLTALVTDINKMLTKWYHERVVKDPVEQTYVKYLQCGGMFLSAAAVNGSSSVVNVGLMPDKLHPNAQGMKLWLSACVIPAARREVAKRQAKGKASRW